MLLEASSRRSCSSRAMSTLTGWIPHIGGMMECLILVASSLFELMNDEWRHEYPRQRGHERLFQFAYGVAPGPVLEIM